MREKMWIFILLPMVIAMGATLPFPMGTIQMAVGTSLLTLKVIYWIKTKN